MCHEAQYQRGLARQYPGPLKFASLTNRGSVTLPVPAARRIGAAANGRARRQCPCTHIAERSETV